MSQPGMPGDQGDSRILDLRTIVAQRELEEARKQRIASALRIKAEQAAQRERDRIARQQESKRRTREAMQNALSFSWLRSIGAPSDSAPSSAPVIEEPAPPIEPAQHHYEDLTIVEDDGLVTHISIEELEWPGVSPAEVESAPVESPAAAPVVPSTSAPAPSQSVASAVVFSADTRSASPNAATPDDMVTLFQWRRIVYPLGAFIGVCVLIVAPITASAGMERAGALQDRLLISSEEAFASLSAAGDSIQKMDFESASGDFDSAIATFEEMQSELSALNGVLLFAAERIPGKGKEVQAGRHLIEAGHALALAGDELTQALALFSATDISELIEDEEQGITPLLLLAHAGLTPATEQLQIATDHLSRVDLAAVPEDKQQLVSQAQVMLPTITDSLIDAHGLIELSMGVLGHQESKRYLVLSQNPAELRPTGGFIGSVVVMDVRNGIVTEFEAPEGGVYDISGQFTDQIISPEPLHLVNAHWNLQDANWYPHFPTTAEQVQWFYEHSGGSSVDGVIAMNPVVVEELLRLTGSIDLTEEFGVVIDHTNFFSEVQGTADEAGSEDPRSKKLVGALLPELLNRVFATVEDPLQLIELLAQMRTHLDAGDIQLALNDEEAHAGFSARGWAGEIQQTDKDYLYVNHANIGGGKSDLAIDEVVRHTAQIQEDGRIVNTVTITRVHKAPAEDPLSGVKNTTYTRVYVPEGSTLRSAEGFDTPDRALFFEPDADAVRDETLDAISGTILTDSTTGVSTNAEFGKTVFGGWVQTPVSGSTTVTLEYELPFRIDTSGWWKSADTYSLLVQKQPGARAPFFISDIELDSAYVASDWYPPQYEGSQQQVLTDDYFAGMVIENAR